MLVVAETRCKLNGAFAAAGGQAAGNQAVRKIACKHSLPQFRHPFDLHDSMLVQRARLWRRAGISAIEASVREAPSASQQGWLLRARNFATEIVTYR